MSSKTANKKCAGCALDLLTLEQLKCNTCFLRYHFECINTSKRKFKEISQDFKSSWVCPTCRSKEPKGDNSNTPVRYTGTTSEVSPTTHVTLRRANPSTTTQSARDFSLDDVKELIQEAMDDLLDKMERRMTKVVETKAKEIFSEINDIKDSISYLNAQHEDIQKQLQLRCDQVEKLTEENGILKSTIKDLGNRLNIMEQHSRLCNLEVQCIPEHKNENLLNVMVQIAKVTGHNLQEGDVHKCTRIAKINPENKRPRSVVVKFSNPRVRDTFMANVIQYNKKHRDNKLNTSHIGIAGEKKPIYVVDHLIPETKRLHALARDKAKQLQYKFVWVKNGRIFMRKTESSEHIMIRDFSQLESLS
ncbi:uncharacterized protein [Epargyreus clarus]|uniref:uncharacterized protein n=1 Tax=Epargyreus clarus TaxID=520877 RepID=UPI003C2C143E